MASKKPFTHLHFHTQYSLLDGACKVSEVMKTAREMDMRAVALTDHGVLFGAIDFYKTAVNAGIKPLLGCEVYMTPADTRMHERKTGPGKSQSNHLVLLAEDKVGYANLIRLVSKAHLEGFYYKPRIDKQLLREHARGLVGLSACLKGEVAEACAGGDVDKATMVAEEFMDILGKDNYYLELQDHGIPAQRLANEGILEVKKRTGLPLVVTNDVHYVKPGHHEAHDCMICLQTGTVRSNPNRMRYNSQQFYMKSPQEMWDRWSDLPEALMNTMEVAERCCVELDLSGKNLHFPTYQTPGGMLQDQFLVQLAEEGMKLRYGLDDRKHPKNPDEKTVVDRFEYELGVLQKMGFINYFLVVWDFIHFAKTQNIPVGPGRGSGAGSIIAYLLGITGIDPLQYGLIFERFLNPERVSMPDFDIDFCQARRGEVIEYVKDKYGRENVAQIITFGSLGPKTVIRDVGRVLEIPFSECDRLAKLIPEEPGMTLDKALELNPDFKKAVTTEENAGRIMEYARVLEGLPRNPGTHAAGVVIGEIPLIEILPLTRDKDNEVITQFEMKPLEMTGLLKMDFLGLKTLTVIRESLDNIKKTRDVDLDLDHLSMDDEATFELLNRGDTIGVFQVESQGMRDLLRRIRLSRFEELIAMIALYRPGPMNMLDDYVNRKHGKVPIKFDHPLLEPILKETFGVMLYQEQVQQAANVLAGFSLGQGDLLRRAMGKKIASEMARQRDQFVKGCRETNKINERLAGRIFDNIERFAGYGFNKSHSAAYAILSYQTAYLKAHYPAEFMAALLSSEMGNADKLPKFIAECQELGLKVLPPNINESEVRFFPVGGGIRFGMAGIKNVGVGAVEALVKDRTEHGVFEGLVNFCSRVDGTLVNKKVLESLVTSGAFDFTGVSRGRLFGAIEFAYGRAAEALRDRLSGQGSLFALMDEDAEAENDEKDLPPGKPWPMSKMLAGEKELLGFYISGHPLKEFEWSMETFSLHSVERLAHLDAGTPTRVGGLVVQFAKRFTRKDQKPMATFRLEGLDGSVEVVAFPETYQDFGVHLRDDAPVMVCGTLDKEEGDRTKILAQEVYPLAEAHKFFAKRISIHLPRAAITEPLLHRVRDILKRYPGTTPVSLCVIFPKGEKIFIRSAQRYHAESCHELWRELELELGEVGLYVAALERACRRENGNGRNRRGGFRGNGR